MTLTVLMNAGPWLAVPPHGYGGIENVVATLVPELRRLGTRVVLATVAESDLPVDERISVFDQGQFAHLQQPYNRVSGIAHAHMQRVVTELRRRADICLVHDHLEVVGASILSTLATVPTLHTLHWDLAKHRDFYANFDGGDTLWVNGVSADQLAGAPEPIRDRSVGHIHLATPFATDATRRSLPHKENHAIVLGRITPAKGQHLAVRVADKAGMPLVLAGPVGPYHDERSLTRAIETDPTATLNPDVRYWCDEVAPLIDGIRVRWVGTVHGAERQRLLATATASLVPIQWREPGGTAVVESLALGTPVVGFARGCVPELIDHGVTGLLAEPNDTNELTECLVTSRDLDPADCVRAAESRFTPQIMAQRYLQAYQDIVDGTPSRSPGR